MGTQTESFWLDEEVGQRVPYATAGAAARQAFARAAQDPKLTLTDHLVLARVVSLTTTYSKLVDQVSFDQLLLGEKMQRQTRRALSKLNDRGIIGYRAGRGRPPKDATETRSVPTIVGVPAAADEKRGQGVSSIDEKRGQSVSPIHVEKRGHSANGKGDTYACARSSEKSSEKQTAAVRASANTSNNEPAAFTQLVAGVDLTGTGRTEALDAWNDDEQRERVEGCVADWKPKHAKGEADVGLLVWMIRKRVQPKRERTAPRPTSDLTTAEIVERAEAEAERERNTIDHCLRCDKPHPMSDLTNGVCTDCPPLPAATPLHPLRPAA